VRRGAAEAHSWICEKTRRGDGRNGQHTRCRGMRRDGGLPGQRGAEPADAAARSIAVALDYVRALSQGCGRTAGRWQRRPAMRARIGRRPRSDAIGRGRNCEVALPGLAAQCLPDDPDDLIGPGIAVDETAHPKKGKGHRTRRAPARRRYGEGGELREPGCSPP
jgi:hypothetical protein